MYLTVRRYRRVEGERQHIVEVINRGFVPLIAAIDGFVDYYCCFAHDGALLSVSVYRDAKGADESVRAAARWVEQNLANHLPDQPEVISGEVFAQRQVETRTAV